MLVIRLQRKGKKNQPSFKIIVTDKRNSAVAGVPVEQIGFVNTLTKERGVNKERVLYWLSVGAQASPTVWNLLVAEGIVDGKKKKINVSKVKNPEKRAAREKAKEDSKQKAAEAAKAKEEEVKVEEVKEEVVEETKTEEVPAEETKTEEVK
ncbi:MAG: 30S ribosomal protein S16 [Candidatus Pacebacteria bacterium]|nr:30S ribosomal protein S16 [Candidatus Paceibacterota bacterium]MDD3919404.1 30S ribosomal protein S16 [Candidatus Paceibacterota bacterium]